ncbi:MAG: hypothetical protein HY704_03600 [Gemmatimonadetes bacterium]|nr:hypothetical protein [Gemmatimonadota bacterium]
MAPRRLARRRGLAASRPRDLAISGSRRRAAAVAAPDPFALRSAMYAMRHGAPRPSLVLILILATLPRDTAGQGARAARIQQTRDHSPPRIAVLPIVGINWMGTRFELDTGTDTALAGFHAELGPGSGAHVGVGLELAATPHLAIATTAAYSRLSYKLRTGTQDEPNLSKGVAGSQDLLRLTAGVQFRLRANAPGYFSAGAAANLIHPRNPTWTPDEEDRIEPGAYLGTGIDFTSKRQRIRLDARLVAAKPSTDPLPSGLGSSATYRARSVAYDLVLSLGLLFDLWKP